MIPTLYEPFRHWSEGGSIFILSDLHFDDEVYAGPLFIADKILLSHEPVYGLSWCLNIHGHDHNNVEKYREDCKHINLAANVCGFTPVNLGKLIKDGILSDIEGIHRKIIDRATERKAAGMSMKDYDMRLEKNILKGR